MQNWWLFKAFENAFYEYGMPQSAGMNIVEPAIHKLSANKSFKWTSRQKFLVDTWDIRRNLKSRVNLFWTGTNNALEFGQVYGKMLMYVELIPC